MAAVVLRSLMELDDCGCRLATDTPGALVVGAHSCDGRAWLTWDYTRGTYSWCWRWSRWL